MCGDGYGIRLKNQDGEDVVTKLIRSCIPVSSIVVFFFNKGAVFNAFFQVTPEHRHLDIPDI
jgi:hypothetical protein